MRALPSVVRMHILRSPLPVQFSGLFSPSSPSSCERRVGSIDEFHWAPFSRLSYSGENIRVLPPATSAEIKQQHAAIKVIDPSWEPHMTTQAELAKCSLLQE